MIGLIFAVRVLAGAAAIDASVMVGTEDPFTAFFSHDWASVGGWSLFVSLCLFIVIGAFREWWAPGGRLKRAETLIAQQQKLIAQQSEQLTKSLDVNKFTQYVMEQVVPRPSSRGHRSTVARRSGSSDDEESGT